MAEYAWPDPQHRSLIGERASRVDGAVKVTGRAKYTYDLNPPGLLYARMLGSPYAHAKIVSIDVSAAEKMPGVKAVKIIEQPGAEVQWAGNEIVDVADVTGPLTRQDLGNMFNNQMPEPQIIQAIQKQGIAFQPTSQYLDMLRKNEVGEEAIKALQSAKVEPPPTGPLPRYRRVTDSTVGDPEAAF